MHQDSPGTLVLRFKRPQRDSDGTTLNGIAPNAGGIGKIVFYDWSGVFRLRHLATENLCPSATVVQVHEGALAEEDAVS